MSIRTRLSAGNLFGFDKGHDVIDGHVGQARGAEDFSPYFVIADAACKDVTRNDRREINPVVAIGARG